MIEIMMAIAALCQMPATATLSTYPMKLKWDCQRELSKCLLDQWDKPGNSTKQLYECVSKREQKP